MWQRSRYRLDGWDALLFVICVLTAAAVAIAFDSRQMSFIEMGFGAAIAAMGVRRKWSPRRDELMYEEAPRAVTLRVLPMLAVGVGGLGTLLGLGAGWICFFGWRSGHLDGSLLAFPAAVCAFGSTLVVLGLRGTRRPNREPTRDEYRGIIPTTPDQRGGVLPPPGAP